MWAGPTLFCLARDARHEATVRPDKYGKHLDVVALVGLDNGITRIRHDINRVRPGADTAPVDRHYSAIAAAGQVHHLVVADLLAALGRVAVIEAHHERAGLARQALETAQEGARILQLRYENGLTSLGELLNVQTTLELARAGVVEKNNAYKTALAVLSFESGILLKDLNIDDNR